MKRRTGSSIAVICTVSAAIVLASQALPATAANGGRPSTTQSQERGNSTAAPGQASSNPSSGNSSNANGSGSGLASSSTTTASNGSASANGTGNGKGAANGSGSTSTDPGNGAGGSGAPGQSDRQPSTPGSSAGSSGSSAAPGRSESGRGNDRANAGNGAGSSSTAMTTDTTTATTMGSRGSAAAKAIAAKANRQEVAVTFNARAAERSRAATVRKAKATALDRCVREELKDVVAPGEEATPLQLADAEETCEASLGTKGDYIVLYAPGTNANEKANAARKKRVGVRNTYGNAVRGLAVTATPAQIEVMRRDPSVQLVEADSVVRAIATYSNATWGLDRIDQRALPLNGTYVDNGDGAGVTAYVIDTGIRPDHVEFTGRVAAGYTAVSDGNGTVDCNGHGTHVAGTIAGATYGVAKATRLVPVRVLDCSGSGTSSGVIAGLDWVAAQHAAGAPAVANMSLGGGASSSLDIAVANLVNDGVTVAVAAGNSSADACTASPARASSALTVGATSSNDARASYSNYGSCLDLFAPGSGIASAWFSSPTAVATLSGTSMATPHVAGAAAALLSRQPSLSPAQVGSAITGAATAGVVADALTGSPNLLLFVEQASSPSPTPTASPSPTPTATVSPSPTPTPTVSAPSPVTNVSARADKRKANVSWTPGSDGGSALTGQWVVILRDGGVVAERSIAPTATSVSITGLARGNYTFRIRTANAVGSAESGLSNTITIR